MLTKLLLVALVATSGGVPVPAIDPQTPDPAALLETTYLLASARPDAVLQAPDATSTELGGLAARLHDGDGTPVPGEIFVLMANPVPTQPARVHATHPYIHSDRRVHVDSIEANLTARDLAGRVLGTAIEPTPLTSPNAGGASVGLPYAIAYLNLATDGAFTGRLRVAATGRLEHDGRLFPVQAVGPKTIAAATAGVDVLFTTSLPDPTTSHEFGHRSSDGTFRARDRTVPLAIEREWDRFMRLGATRPRHGMDIVHVRHLGDVAAYLCGAGSPRSCDVLAELEQLAARTRSLGSHNPGAQTTPRPLADEPRSAV